MDRVVGFEPRPQQQSMIPNTQGTPALLIPILQSGKCKGKQW